MIYFTIETIRIKFLNIRCNIVTASIVCCHLRTICSTKLRQYHMSYEHTHCMQVFIFISLYICKIKLINISYHVRSLKINWYIFITHFITFRLLPEWHEALHLYKLKYDWTDFIPTNNSSEKFQSLNFPKQLLSRGRSSNSPYSPKQSDYLYRSVHFFSTRKINVFRCSFLARRDEDRYKSTGRRFPGVLIPLTSRH